MDPECTTRAATPADERFLWRMLYTAVNWDDQDRHPLDELKADPRCVSYLDPWQERGIFGLVLQDQGRPVGAAWCTFAGAADEIYGFSAADIPVMAIAIDADHRDRHLGRQILVELIELAQSRGHRRMSLEVDAGNDRGRHLYESLGFNEERVEADGATVMVAYLGGAGDR